MIRKNGLGDPQGTENRRQFLARAFTLAALSSLAAMTTSCQAQQQTARPRSGRESVGGGCEGCDLIHESMPRELSWQTAIASASEPGEPMEISGIIYQRDGRTPAGGVILYVYHTDARGYYSPAPETPERARRHGHLRGWVKTNERGQYRFTSIRPAPYPDAQDPAHIHPIIKEPDKNEYWIDEYIFEDDPRLTERERSRRENRGGSGIIRLTKTEGVWKGRRDITLGLNVPNYPA